MTLLGFLVGGGLGLLGFLGYCLLGKLNPLTILAQFIASPMGGIVGFCAAAALLVWGVLERVELAAAHLATQAAQKEASSAKASLQACNVESAGYQTDLNRQNDAIKREVSAEQARQAAASKALAAQRATTAKLEAVAGQLGQLRAKPGESPDAACSRILRQGIGAAQ